MPGNFTQSQGPLTVLKINDWTQGIVTQLNAIIVPANNSGLRVPNASNLVSSSLNTYGVMGLPNGGLLLGPGVYFASNQTFTQAPGGTTDMAVTGVLNSLGGGDAIFVLGFTGSFKTNAYAFNPGTYTKVFSTDVTSNSGSIVFRYASFPFSQILFNTYFINYVGIGTAIACNSTIPVTYSPPASTTDLLNGTGRVGVAIPANGRVWFLESGVILPALASNNQLGPSAISYTDPTTGAGNNIVINSAQTIVDYNNAADFGGWGVYSAAQTLLVKTGNFGGVVVNGDIFNPTVTSVPSIPGTDGLQGTAALSPIGLVYRTKYSGVWAWTGAGNAVKISPQISDSYWIANGSTLFGGNQDYGHYNVQYYHNMLFLDGGLIYDLSTNAWWSLPPYMGNTTGTFPQLPTFYITDYQTTSEDFFAVASNGNNRTGTKLAVVNYSFNMNDSPYAAPSGYYHAVWESNPIQLALDDVVEIEEISVVMQGHGTLQIGVVEIGNTTPTYSNPISVDNQSYKRVRSNMNAQTDVLVLSLTWNNSGTGSDPVPVIESIEVKYRALYPVPVAN